MSQRLNISFDSEMLESISSDFNLRTPNREALRKLVFTLDGDYDPEVQQVLSMATGVGKTYLMAAFIEYLRRQGVCNVVIVTPGKTVQAKTIQNFRPGSPRFIAGASVPPEVVTPQDYSPWISRLNSAPVLSYGSEIPILAFIFNIQQLIPPKDVSGDTHGATRDAVRRKPRRFDEHSGVLFDHLRELDDLVVIADESHLYGVSAASFHSSIEDMDPAVTVGLTASANKKSDHIIYEYPLYRAIQDKYVKAPVLAFRKSGYADDQASEEQQLRDALRLRAIKQEHYDAYGRAQGHKHLNAVVFVVCSDVSHATQVADLLKSPEYFGHDDAVLQVDSQHEDEATQKRLEGLDQPDSPVLAVVSVNKLKEGWDVKNIAVVVTLRAMASEVLTQQTMGRGLRLPFGKYTGVAQIDQLDIITHQSFKDLLDAENVLQQFGLEEAVADPDDKEIKKVIVEATAESNSPDGAESSLNQGNDSRVSDQGATASVHSDGPYLPNGEPTGISGTPGVGVRVIGDEPNHLDSDDSSAGIASDGWGPTEIVTVERNPRFRDISYSFPVTTMRVQKPVIHLSEIADEETERAASRVASTGEVLLRKEIIASLGKALKTVDAESAEVESLPIDDTAAKEALVKLVMNMSQLEKTQETVRFVDEYLVPKFMKNVSFDRWTVKSLASARTELHELIRDYLVARSRAVREVIEVHPRKLPDQGYTLALGDRIHDQIDSRADFRRGRTYGGWSKSLFEAESFDSYSGEYVLAKLLNTSPSIEWWHRLHRRDGARVQYTSRDRYFPDFVAKDSSGVHWIIEGKDERGRDDETVKAKREAAESLVRKLVAEDAYVGQYWGYLIAYEEDTARADTWDDLKTYARPVSNRL